jgi:heat shock protein HslJ
MTRAGGLLLVAVFVTVCARPASAQVAAAPGGAAPLAGTSWQLVSFQGGDGAVLTPDDRAKYTLAFSRDNAVAVRLDCNRGRGTWKSPGAGRLELGPLVVTRAFCPAGSLHDHILKQWGSIRSYALRNGHLFLALMADGGIYEFEPMDASGGAAAVVRSPVPSRGPIAWNCTRAGAGGTSQLRVTFYETRPGMVLLERDGVTRPAFQVRTGSGTRFEGDGVLFREARGEATLQWMGVEWTCTR